MSTLTFSDITKGQSEKPQIKSVLYNRQYILYFAGQFISQTGTWMQQMALAWFTYSLNNNPVLLAVVGAASQLPSFVLMPFAGVLADRLNRHKILIIIQSLALLQAAILAALTLLNLIQPWHLVALALFQGIINAFDLPVRSSFLADLTAESSSDLPGVIAINSTINNITRVLGPALSGFVVSAVGVGICFLLNAISYIAVIVALLFINVTFLAPAKTYSGLYSELHEAFNYINCHPIFKKIITFLSFYSFGAMSYLMLLPMLVKGIGGNANLLGCLMSANAIGSLTGAMLYLKSKLSTQRFYNILSVCAFVSSSFLITLSWTRNVWALMIILSVLGAAMMFQMIGCMTLVQSEVDKNKRGRVMSLFLLSVMGSASIGGIISGAIAKDIGFANTMNICCCYGLLVTGGLIISNLYSKYAASTKQS